MAFETPSATTPAPIFAFAVVVGKYYSLAGLVLLIYDHLTTLDREVERIWSTRFTAASLLFYLNRYLTLLLYVTLTAGVFDKTWSVQTCQHFIIIPAVGTVVLQGVTSLVMLLRTYALWSRKTPILIILVAAYLVLMALSVRAMVAGRRYNPEQFLYPGCMIIVPGALRLNPLVHAWLTLIFFDTIVVALTLWRTLSIHRMGGKMPLTTLLLRDGVAYFAAIGLANLSYFFIYAVAVPVNMTVAQAISAIMTSRLILNLRQESRATTVVDEDDSVNFHRSGKSGAHLSQNLTTQLETHGQLDSHYDPRQDVSRGTKVSSMVPRLSDVSPSFDVGDLESGSVEPPKYTSTSLGSQP
jgi:hypothetical protein